MDPDPRIDDLRFLPTTACSILRRSRGQNFCALCCCKTDTRREERRAGGPSTSYAVRRNFLVSFLTEHTFKLLEAAAGKAAQALLLRYPLIRGGAGTQKAGGAHSHWSLSVSVRIPPGLAHGLSLSAPIWERSRVISSLRWTAWRTMSLSGKADLHPHHHRSLWRGGGEIISEQGLPDQKHSIPRRNCWTFSTCWSRQPTGSARFTGGRERWIWIFYFTII